MRIGASEMYETNLPVGPGRESLKKPQPETTEGLECKLCLRVCPEVGKETGLPNPLSGQPLAEGCPQQTSISRHFQLCGHVGKVGPGAKGNFQKRCLRCRIWEAKAQRSGRGVVP